MRTVSFAAAAVILTIVAATARGDQLVLEWDNFLTFDPATDGGFDRVSYFASERDAAVPDAWVVDDVLFDHDVPLKRFEWAGAHDRRFGYGSVELIILEDIDETLHVIYQLSLGQPVVEATFGLFYGLETYNAYIEIPDSRPTVTLLAGRHYYLGVRLVYNDGHADGRNVALTTGYGTINGLTTGRFQSYFFGYPDWTPVEQTAEHLATDFAFRVWSPEPGSLMILLGGLLLVRRRKPPGDPATSLLANRSAGLPTPASP